MSDTRVAAWYKYAINALGAEVDASVRRTLDRVLDDQVLVENALDHWEKYQKDSGGYNDTKGWQYAQFTGQSISARTNGAITADDLDEEGRIALMLFNRVDDIGLFFQNTITNAKSVDRHMFEDNARDLLDMVAALGGPVES